MQKQLTHPLSTSFLIVVLLTIASTSYGQLLTMNFNVDSTTTVVGLTPTSISPSAGTLSGGSSGKGLAAQRDGTVAKRDIDLDFPNTSDYWNVSGLDLAIDFQREESTGDFFTRLSNDFRFGMNGGQLNVRYEVSDGMGGSTTVNSGNIQAIPNDDTWRRYGFTYDPNTGIGAVTVDGLVVWSNDGPDNRAMYWVGAGNFRIGNSMDASGAVEAVFDSISVSSIDLLPVELTSFSAARQGNHVLTQWETSIELNNDFFLLERRNQGSVEWIEVTEVMGNGTTNTPSFYSFTDRNVASGKLEYRLTQVDLNGVRTVKNAVLVEALMKEESSLPYPNPVEAGGMLYFDQANSSTFRYTMYDLLGNRVFESIESKESALRIPSELLAGQYFLFQTDANNQQAFTIVVR